MKRKAQGLPLNVVIVAALVLIVFVVLVVILKGRIGAEEICECDGCNVKWRHQDNFSDMIKISCCYEAFEDENGTCIMNWQNKRLYDLEYEQWRRPKK